MTTLLSTYGLPYLAGKWISPSLMRDWLSIPNVNTFIMIMTGIWQGIGLNMLLFISGLRNMDYTPVEASMIEGAGGLTLYTKVNFTVTAADHYRCSADVSGKQLQGI